MRKRLLFLISLLVFITTPAWAQELYVHLGQTENTGNHEQATRWGLEYRQGLAEHLAVGLTYINEGHVSGHHRDGYEPQVWYRTNVIERKLSLAAGIGPYLYFDTVSTDHGASRDEHGWGTVVSVAATWYTESRFLYELRGNWIGAVNGFNSVSVTAGIGYQLDAPPAEGPLQKAPRETVSATGNELTLFAGQSVLNRPGSRTPVAEGLEYRRGIAPHIDATIGLLNEGPRGGDRRGVAGQAWVVRTYFDERLSFGLGFGPYLAHDGDRGRDGSTGFDGLIGLTAGYSFGDHWVGRFVWDRVLTTYDHDADIFLAGLGYRF